MTQDLAVGGNGDVGQRKAAVESLISLIVRIAESHAQLAQRLLWVEQEPVQFVKDVSPLASAFCRRRGQWNQ